MPGGEFVGIGGHTGVIQGLQWGSWFNGNNGGNGPVVAWHVHSYTMGANCAGRQILPGKYCRVGICTDHAIRRMQTMCHPNPQSFQ